MDKSESVMYIDNRVVGQELWVLGDPREALVRIPDDILDTVAFLCVHSGEWLYGGTGVFVHVVSGFDPSRMYGYFVTAKHNVVNAKKYGDLYVRLNDTRGGTHHVKIVPEWIFPEDPSVDLAVIPWAPPRELAHVYYMPSDGIASDELLAEHSIGVGDDLFIAGLFTRHYGKTRNIPIVRTGTIAAMPSEPLSDSKTGLNYSGYLIEARSIGGLSGSPVFAYIGPDRFVPGKHNPGGLKIFLIGIIRGHWDHEERVDAQDFALAEELRQVNMGIAVATPSQEILKILYSEELVKRRKEMDIEMAKASGVKEDSAFEKPQERPFSKEDFQDALKRASKKVE